VNNERAIEIPDDVRRMARAVCGSHTPSDSELILMNAVRATAAEMIAVLMQTPAGPDRTAAIRKVREALMTANAGICMRGTSPYQD